VEIIQVDGMAAAQVMPLIQQMWLTTLVVVVAQLILELVELHLQTE
jgi:hypothetical protein